VRLMQYVPSESEENRAKDTNASRRARANGIN
jgi:hypothetical protein